MTTILPPPDRKNFKSEKEYKKAYLAPKGEVTILIEYGDFYNEK